MKTIKKILRRAEEKCEEEAEVAVVVEEEEAIRGDAAEWFRRDRVVLYNNIVTEGVFYFRLIRLIFIGAAFVKLLGEYKKYFFLQKNKTNKSFSL